jgi:hypothetical protein
VKVTCSCNNNNCNADSNNNYIYTNISYNKKNIIQSSITANYFTKFKKRNNDEMNKTIQQPKKKRRLNQNTIPPLENLEPYFTIEKSAYDQNIPPLEYQKKLSKYSIIRKSKL